ncbi:MAG: hypothetical protein ABI658_17635 [Acidimicrobiales bacterium]
MSLVIGMVLSLAHDASGATVAVATPSGPTDVHIDVIPDTVGAERVRRTLRYCTLVRLSCDGGHWSSRVNGVGHYRPADLRISVATALGLPCVVRLP